MQQSGLFERVRDESAIVAEGALPRGLIFVPNFVAASEERELVGLLDDAEHAVWLTDLSRRVQHFGYRYNYKLRALSSADKIDDAPTEIQALGARLVELGYFATPPDQVIVNEYLPGQGISSHIDRETCFGSTVASLSIGTDVVMDFRSEDGAIGALLLSARSLVVLTGDARYRWRHSIAARKSDRIGEREFARGRRLSLTFRTVLTE